MNKKVKLAIVDDHCLFREGLASLVDKFDWVDLIMEANNGKELIEQLQNHEPDVILMDLKMPIMDGLKATAYVRQEYPDIKVIPLTMYDEKKYIIEAIKAGAHSYLFKSTGLNEVESAIHSVMEKGFYFNNFMTEAMYQGLAHKKVTKPAINKKDRLTKRELQMLTLICKQLTGPEIARKLNLSPKTIENYRYKLVEKLNVKNTAGLIIYAIQNGLVAIDLKKKSNW